MSDGKPSENPPPKIRASVRGWGTWVGVIGFAALSTAILVLVLLFGDTLYPPPTPMPSPTVALDDEGVVVLLDRTLSCKDRMEALAYLDPCDLYEGIHGWEARCPLDAPLAELVYGCGREEENPEEEWLRVVPQDDRGRAKLQDRAVARFGPCEVVLAGRANGNRPRWPSDPGLAVCLFTVETPERTLKSELRTFEGGDAGFPMGVYLEYDGAEVGPRAKGALLTGTSPKTAPLLTSLAIDTELLDDGERAAAAAQIGAVLSLWGEE